MTEKKEEWEIGYSRENPESAPSEAKTVNFQKSASLVGQILDGRFFIEKDLTEGGADAGGIGLVYLARDVKLMGKETVVKILQKAALDSPDMARKFQHEKEALIRLDHPNIVRILDSGDLSDGNPFMVMEFIEGYSLRRRLNERRKLDLAEAAHYIEAVTDALSAAHSKKILHRDIKPENIMLTPQEHGRERIRLIDFGIARVENSILAPLTEIPRGIGTILYIAPEQLAGNLEQTPAVDIYSLAIAAYEMLTGEYPFKPHSMFEMYQLQTEGVKIPPRQLRPEIPVEAERLLLSALEFDPSKRPQNARQFGRELAGALRHGTTGEKSDQNPALAQTQPSPSIVDPKPTILPTQASTGNAAEPTRPSFGSIANNVSAGRIESDFSEFTGTSQRTKKPKAMAVGAGLGLLILMIGTVGTGWFFWKNYSDQTTDVASNQSVNANPPIAQNKAARKLNYYLNVQKTRDGRPFGDAFESSGREIFENGYKFRLNFSADAKGFFYLFNEGRDKAGKVNYNILFPLPVSGKDTAETEKDELMQTEWNTFGGKADTEKVWLIWTKDKQTSLENAVSEAFAQRGRVADREKETALRKFIEEYGKQKLNADLEKDDSKKRINLSGENDIIVHLIELEHR